MTIRNSCWSMFLAMLSLGCEQTTATPAGPLPLALQLQPRSASATWAADAPICAAEPFAPATVGVRWSTASDGDARYVTALEVSLEAPSDGLIVEVPTAATIGGASLEPDSPWVDLVDITFACERRAFRFPRVYEHDLRSMVQVDASGQLTVDGARVQATPVP